jgi:ABC-type Fe3+/spermidine/putrescine transport system ATPase subunit
MIMPDPHLELRGLSAAFGQTLAVDALSLSVRRGELVSLLGPSGCGKTTTLRMVAGFVFPSAGQVLVGGQDVTRLPSHKRNMGVVFQSYALFPHLTVLDNVAFGLRMRGMGASARRARAAAALDLVALSKLADRYPSQLSGGQQQRVALARALVIEPALLLLDEPLSNLDAHLRADMRSEIRQLQQRLAITTLFVTHDQEEALAMSDRVCVMNQGSLIEVGTPMALCDHPAEPFTARFLGARTLVTGKTEAGAFIAPGLVCADAPAGASAIILRAARLRLGVAQVGPLALSGTLTGTAYLGDSFELDVTTQAGSVRVLSPSDLHPPPLGSHCHVNVLQGGVSFISASP